MSQAIFKHALIFHELQDCCVVKIIFVIFFQSCSIKYERLLQKSNQKFLNSSSGVAIDLVIDFKSI
jgi:hypothetical protein